MSASHSQPGKPAWKARLASELKKYAVVSLYLFICFSVVLLYEASQSATEASLLTFGIALGKSLVLGKFILIGDALEAGTRIAAPTLLHRVAWRTTAMLVVLIVFKIIEEVIVGMAHSQGFAELVAELQEEGWIGVLGPVLLMLLILVPMITAIELDSALGGGKLKDLMLRSQK